MKFTIETQNDLFNQITEILSDHFDNVTDVTYHNDARMSLSINEYILFMPNSLITDYDKECVNYYRLMLDEDYGIFNEEAYTFSSTSFEDIISELNNIIK
jgi:hypothetical protein